MENKGDIDYVDVSQNCGCVRKMKNKIGQQKVKKMTDFLIE
jgi:hypothetical protein